MGINFESDSEERRSSRRVSKDEGGHGSAAAVSPSRRAYAEEAYALLRV
jgi:hypothetical protein